MSGILRNGQRQNNFNRNYNNTFASNRQAPMRNGRFVRNKTVVNRGPGIKNTAVSNGNNGPNRDVVIRRNIEHMKLVAQKKRVAQERYYGQGQSPMVRTGAGSFGKQDPKGRMSVQNRLGSKSALRTTNSPNFAPRRTNQPFIGGLRSDKLARVQSLQKKKQIRFQDAIKTISSSGQVVYLQPVRNRAPNNYTVRVDNDRKPHYNNKHHVAKDLNPQLQQEIKLIQNKNMRQVMTAVPAPLPAPVHLAPHFDQIDRLPIVATARTLHERFSMI